MLTLQAQEIVSGFIAMLSPYMIVFILGLVVGSLAPTYFAAEQLRGFGRAMLAKLPYEPPPGKDEKEALIEATDEAKKATDEEDDQ